MDASHRTLDGEAESLFYIGAGPMAAIVLGMVLTPLRELTTASNLTFAFIVLTIAVGELGGRWAAIMTALASALSLNFFLTRPYLTLAIHDRDDVIAFAGLAVCGLVAASVAAQRNRKLGALAPARDQLELVRHVLGQIESSGDLEKGLAQVLRLVRDNLPLKAALVRDPRGYVIASSDNAAALLPLPDEPLSQDMPLPEAGGRIALTFAGRSLGWLDVWGNGSPADRGSRRTLGPIAQLVALYLAAADPRAAPRA